MQISLIEITIMAVIIFCTSLFVPQIDNFLLNSVKQNPSNLLTVFGFDNPINEFFSCDG